MKQMDRANLNGIELEYEVQGAGEPVVLVHWGISATWAEPLLEAPALSEGYLMLNYHRAGFAGSSRVRGPITIAQHADHCRLLMRYLGVDRGHIVGHSSSAVIALQLALDAPEAVRSLTLMESARPAPRTQRQMDFVRAFVEPAIQRYEAGDKAGAMDTFFQGVFGREYRPALDQGLPGAFMQSVADADAFFGQELRALQQWSFTQEDASRITQPVLAVLGEKSARIFRERRELLLAWLPNVQPFNLPDATHLLHVQNAPGMAHGLAAFIARQR
jgi:pimeloyl-ACP methyl ester carboxylesterase